VQRKIHRKIIRLPKCKDKTGNCRSTIYKLIAEGKFPKPVKLTGRSVGWFEDEVDEYLESLPRAEIGPAGAG